MQFHPSRGYMLLETTVAILILGIVAIGIHGATQQAIQTRGQSQDFTQVRFLMEDYMAKLTLQRQVMEEFREGVFDQDEGRFSYECTIRPVVIPPPLIPSTQDSSTLISLEGAYPEDSSFMVHIALTVKWTRGTIPFEETIETLLHPNQLYIPEDLLPLDIVGFENE